MPCASRWPGSRPGATSGFPSSAPLKGYFGVWRVRVGNYRICYQIDDGLLLILVITISTRDNVNAVLRPHSPWSTLACAARPPGREDEDRAGR